MISPPPTLPLSEAEARRIAELGGELLEGSGFENETPETGFMDSSLNEDFNHD